MSLESVRPLIDNFHNGAGIECYIPIVKLNRFIDILRGMHVFYRVPEAREYEYHTEEGIDPYIYAYEQGTDDFIRFMEVYVPAQQNTTEAALATSAGAKLGGRFNPGVGLSYTSSPTTSSTLTSIQIVWSKKELIWWEGVSGDYPAISL